MESIIKRVLNNNWASLKTDIEKMASDRIQSRVNDKKIEVLAKLNDVNSDKMKEIINVSK